MSLAAPAPLSAALQVVQSFRLVLSGCQAVVVSCMGPVKSQRGPWLAALTQSSRAVFEPGEAAFAGEEQGEAS